MESGPQTRPAVTPKPIAPPRLKKVLTKATADSPQSQQQAHVAEKPDKKPPPPIAPYSNHVKGNSPQLAPRPAARSNGESSHLVPVAKMEGIPPPKALPRPPPKPPRRISAEKLQGTGEPSSPGSEVKGQDCGGSEGPPVQSTVDGGRRVATVAPYLVVDIMDLPVLSGEGLPHTKVDTQIESPSDVSSHSSNNTAHPSVDTAHPSVDTAHPSVDTAHPSVDTTHPSVDSAHPSIDSARSSIDPTQPPVERRRRQAPPPPPKPANRPGGTLSDQVQLAPAGPAVDHAECPPPSATATSKCSPPGSTLPGYPAPPPHAHGKGVCDPAVDSTGNSEEGDAKGNSPSTPILPDSAVVEKQSTAPRPRRKAPPPPVQPFNMPIAPLHRKMTGSSSSSLTRSNSLPRQQRHDHSTDSKYATLQDGSRSRSLQRFHGQLVEPPAEKEREREREKKGKLQLRGWLKKLSGSPSSKRKAQSSNNDSGAALKRASVKKGKMASSHSCDDKLAEAMDTGCYAVVGWSQPATPLTPGADSYNVNVVGTPPAPVVDTPTLDSDAYALMDVPAKPARRQRPLQADKQQTPSNQTPSKPESSHEPVYATVNKKKKAERKVSEEAPAALCNTSSSGLYEEVIVRQEKRIGSKVVRQSSKLRLSRALSAESFNLEDFDEEEAVQMWGGRVISPVGEAEDMELTTEGQSLDQNEGVSLAEDEGVALSENGGVTPNQEVGVTPNQEVGVSPNQEVGVSPNQVVGVSPKQEVGVSPNQEVGVSPKQEVGVSPKQEGVSPKASKRPPPPVPLPYSKYKELQAAQMEAADGADAGISSSLQLPSPSHTSPGTRSAPGTLRGCLSSQQGSAGPLIHLSSALINLNAEEEEDDTDWEDDSDEDDDEDSSRPKAYHIAKEILTTERTFVQRLTLLDQGFRGAIDSYNRSHDRPVVSEETMKQILSNVGSLRQLNTDFLDKLEQRFKSWDACPRIGDIMSGFAPYLKMYSEYISKFDGSLRVLDETMKRNPAFHELVKEFEAQPMCANLSVANYMLETVQRIPRYQLLLQDYIKHLPEDSDDTKESQKALDCIARVAQDVNESMRQMDNFKKLVEIEKKLVGDVGGSLITPTRKLLKEGEVTKFSRKERTPRMFFLFSDILLYATTAQPPSFASYKVIKRIPLLGLRMEDLDDPEVKHGFQIISTSKSFRLEASSEEDKKQWLKLTRQAIRELEEIESTRKERRKTVSPFTDGDLAGDAPLGHYAPPWLPDSCVSMCMACTVSFTMTRRRHHCRACGNVFCHHCTCFEGVLRYKDNKMERVCQTCYEVLKQQGVHVKTAKQSKLSSSLSLSLSSSRVLQEVKARDQSSERSGYLFIKGKRGGWKRRWFVLSNLALYSFAKHEDRAAKESIIVPSHKLVYPFEEDPLQFCLKHTGTGTTLFKGEEVEDIEGWVEVLQMAAIGESSVQLEEQSVIRKV